ncbi:hypothetical protein RS130_17260 [Paraglaciecola aquimarina]|uniref:FTP domain-containing protein n=1 Tax=Paraglaciecola aquimarina TaxID=1235557 RepID=A0ABU3SZH7_9ALTE|nr:hypothetical protein [Paraglaciecola aquimarina]MDU0355421.1 hypothetical protein [Paraglaciecola aquimarina]
MHHVGKLVATMCLALNTSTALAEKPKGAGKLLADTAGNAQISVNKNTGHARFIRLKPTSQLGPVKSSARRTVHNAAYSSMTFLQNYGSAFGIVDLDAELKFVETKRDKLGSEHSIFEQYYKGLPVFAGDLRTHFNASGEMIAVNGNFLTDIKAPTKAKLTLAQAKKVAFELVDQDPTQQLTTENIKNAGNREQK